jgi:hypothetical protein
MSYDEIRNTIVAWQQMLPSKTRKYIHYRSMRNFVWHFNEIRSERDRDKVLNLLAEYVQSVQDNDYIFDRHSSPELATRYLYPLVDYYRVNSRFMEIMKLQFVLIIGVLVDSILYFTNILSALHYIPVTTVFLLLYYAYLLIFKIPEGRVYGLFY